MVDRLAVAQPPVVNMSPDGSAMPATNVIQGPANGLDSWALIAAMVGVVIGAVISEVLVASSWLTGAPSSRRCAVRPRPRTAHSGRLWSPTRRTFGDPQGSA
jgi:hypothetical protein